MGVGTESFLKVITRETAKAVGSRKFYTGIPCKHGHISERYVLDGKCCACMSANCHRWHAANPGANAEGNKAWRQKNRDKYLSGWRRWWLQNKQKHYQHCDKWRRANPLAAMAITERRRARKANAEGKFSPSDVHRIQETQGYKCAICPTSIRHKYHVDHIQPLSKGGSNWPRNLQLLCPSCNLSKGSRDPIEFMQSRGCLL